MIESLASGTRTARKPHRCFHCCRAIAPGTKYGYQTNKYDYVYTISWHLDCEKLASEYRELIGQYYDGDGEGWRGLREDWCDSGEYHINCDDFRGFYPHVIARLELTDQLWDANI
jgi:hypothetical protein